MSGSLVFAYPGRLDLRTGGYAYDRHILDELETLGWTITRLSLGDGFPQPSAGVRSLAETSLSDLPNGTLVMIDGLAFGVLPDWARANAERLRIVALVHHPLALETGVLPEDRISLTESETTALRATRHVIVTSAATGRELQANFAVSADRITVALPGTAPGPISTAGQNSIPRIVSVGTLTRRKGHDVLIRALHRLRDASWHATIFGSRDLDPATSDALQQQVQDLDLTDRITLAGECEDARAEMAAADVFALASRYEGYGMVFAEALAAHLPIVACHAGAVPDVVPSEAGILVPVDDDAAFAVALRGMITDLDRRAMFSEGSAEAARRLPTWSDTAATISRQLTDIR